MGRRRAYWLPQWLWFAGASVAAIERFQAIVFFEAVDEAFDYSFPALQRADFLSVAQRAIEVDVGASGNHGFSSTVLKLIVQYPYKRVSSIHSNEGM